MKGNEERYKLTDLHCHILPGIDDGAKDEKEALTLLKKMYDSGIRQVALTSHFSCEKQLLSEFLSMREQAWNRLVVFAEKENVSSETSWKIMDDMKLKLGAEVFFSPNLKKLDLKKLCIEETNFMLLELPVERMPSYFNETVSQIQAYGVTPIIAHVERYPYIMDNLPILCDWIDRGLYVQINAGTLLRKGNKRKKCLKLLSWNLVHILASDTHSVKERPPNLAESIDFIKIKSKKNVVENMLKNADMIFHGNQLAISSIYCPRKFLGRWI